MSGRLSTLLREANTDLVPLGVEPRPNTFVCPMCLRMLPVADASVGHYPAKVVPALARRSALVCRGCNSFMGSAYESDAAVFLATGMWSTRLSFPGGGTVKGSVEATNEDGKYKMRMTGKAMGREFQAMRTRSADPTTLMVEMWRPHEEVGKRALLAWSLLEWSKFAGYRYMGSAGAAHARRLALDDSIPLPPTIFTSWGSIGPELVQPEASIVTWSAQRPKSLVEDGQEYFGIGVRWGRAMILLPFANDDAGRAWERIGARTVDGKITGLWPWPLPALVDRFGHDGLHAEMRLSDEERGLDLFVTRDLTRDEAEQLASGSHPLRLTPPRQRRAPRRHGDAFQFQVDEGRLKS